jgi:small-conductance mechanosensitive channel
MIQAFISSQRAAATAVAFILTYFVALTLGRFFKRRAQVPLGLFFQTFCLTLAFYAAITVYGVQADWRKHVGAALVLLSPAFIIAFANHFLWDFYFEKKRQTPIPHILREIFALLVFLITLLLVLSFGYHAEAQLKGLLAGSGIVAIIVGFAGQNLFGGIIAGIQLQISRPFRVGDWLQVGERFAEVMEINWRSTRLRTNDGIYLDIPNNEIVRETIVNLHYPTQVHAMRIRVGIDYKTPPNRVKDALMRATRNAELVLRDPPPKIFLVDFADHAVIYEIKFYMGNHAAINEVNDAIRTNVWYELKRQQISIPYPIRTLHVERRPRDRGGEDQEQAAFSVPRGRSTRCSTTKFATQSFRPRGTRHRGRRRGRFDVCALAWQRQRLSSQKRCSDWCWHAAFWRLLRRNVAPDRRTPHRHGPRRGRLLRSGNQQISNGRSHSPIARISQSTE